MAMTGISSLDVEKQALIERLQVSNSGLFAAIGELERMAERQRQAQADLIAWAHRRVPTPMEDDGSK